MTWLKAKKDNELKSFYPLAGHEIILIKSEFASIRTDQQLSKFVVKSEAALSGEHTPMDSQKERLKLA